MSYSTDTIAAALGIETTKPAATVTPENYRLTSMAYGQPQDGASLLNGPPSATYLSISAARSPGMNARMMPFPGENKFGQQRTSNQNTIWTRW